MPGAGMTLISVLLTDLFNLFPTLFFTFINDSFRCHLGLSQLPEGSDSDTKDPPYPPMLVAGSSPPRALMVK